MQIYTDTLSYADTILGKYHGMTMAPNPVSVTLKNTIK